MRATTSIRNGALVAVGVMFVIALVGLGVHHPVTHERARSLGPPATNPAQVEASNVTAPPASPALTGAATAVGGSGLAAQGSGAIAGGSAPIPNTGARSMLVPGCLLLALALGARRLVKRAA